MSPSFTSSFVPCQQTRGAKTIPSDLLPSTPKVKTHLPLSKTSEKSSNRVVNAAIISNTVVMIGKFGAGLWTGSGSMIAEGVHSLADVFNQILLKYGIYRSQRKPDSNHPYGYSKERFAWALVSATSVFFLGSGVTMYHGFAGLFYPRQLEDIAVAFWVLGGSMIIEGITLIIAYKAVKKAANDQGMTVIDYLKRGSDPMAVAVMLEDSAAIAGIFIAGTGVGLTYMTGDPIYDALGSLGVGTLLGGTAWFLGWRNMGSLIGRSIEDEHLQRIITVLEADPVVRSIHNVKAVTEGTGVLRFKADLAFDGREVSRIYLNTHTKHKEKLKQAIQNGNDAVIDAAIEDFSFQLVEQLGDEIDRIESNIRKMVPDVQHIDLEVL